MTPRERIIVALDVFTLGEAEKLVSALHDRVGAFKIGLQLLTSCGSPTVVQLLNRYDIKIFYDAKFSDIPNTVGQASKAVSELGVWMFNIHASSGAEAIRYAAKNKGASKLIAVTVLTSLSDDASTFVFGEAANDKSVSLARLAVENGADGVVCSPHEIESLRSDPETAKLMLVVPGIRPRWAATDDQSRFMEPAKAITLGADYLVIGRPITNPPAEVGDPASAVDRICAEMESAQVHGLNDTEA